MYAVLTQKLNVWLDEKLEKLLCTMLGMLMVEPYYKYSNIWNRIHCNFWCSFSYYILLCLCCRSQCRAILTGGHLPNHCNRNHTVATPPVNPQLLGTPPQLHYLSPNSLSISGHHRPINPVGVNSLIPNPPEVSSAAIRLTEYNNHPAVCPGLANPASVTVSLNPLLTSRGPLPYYTRGGYKLLRTRIRHRGMSMGNKVSG